MVVVSPLYSRVLDHPLSLVEEDIFFESGDREVTVSIYRSDDQPHIYFVDLPALYYRDGLYTNDPDEHLRFIVLTRAALELCQRWGWAPDIVHANDWQTALAPLFLRSIYSWDRLFQRTRTVFTIHNLGYQGMFDGSIAADLGLGEGRYLLHQDHLQAGYLMFMEHGLMYADAITTVSPTYSREIQEPGAGFGLDGLLRSRSHDLVGILNGIDPAVWNPRTDRYLAQRFSVKSLWRKEKAKESLLASLGLTYSKGAPVVGMVTRLSWQKGLDLLPRVLVRFLDTRNVSLVVLGSGETRYEELFIALARAYPDRVAYRNGYDEPLAHQIEAGSDIFLMPSRYEPSGLNQMYSQAYGTAPVVHRTGGLADTVVPFDEETGVGTGFVFEHLTPDGVAWALGRALDTFARPTLWRQLQKNMMAEDNSWERRAHEYEAVYEGLFDEEE